MRRLPSTDVYFMNACADMVSGWLRRAPVRRLGANSFTSGAVNLLVRRDEEEIMNRLLADTQPLVYLIDDDIVGAARSEGLPDHYRERLADFARRFHWRLVERAATVVVTSQTLANLFSEHPDVRRLKPYWNMQFADDSHFDAPELNWAIRAVHLGTESHGSGIKFLVPIITRLVEENERFHFTYFSKTARLGAIDLHPRVERRLPKSWRTYRRWVSRQRFHLGLYPLPFTAFDRARSQNKLIEHMIVGAVGVYPRDWDGIEPVSDAAILAGPDSEDWIRAISGALDVSDTLKTLFSKARASMETFNDPGLQRDFWRAVLKVDSQ